MQVEKDVNQRPALLTSTTTLGSSNKKAKAIAKFSSLSEFSSLISLQVPICVFPFSII
jgi:hypothetical protein